MDKPGFRNRLWHRRYQHQLYQRHHNPYLPPLNRFQQPGPARAFLNPLFNLLNRLLRFLHRHLLNHSNPVVDRLHLQLFRLLNRLRRPPPS